MINFVLWFVMSDLHILHLFFRPGHRERMKAEGMGGGREEES